jgi:hypothetical protein
MWSSQQIWEQLARLTFKLADSLRPDLQPPEGGLAGLNPVLLRDGLRSRSCVVLRRRYGLYHRTSVHQTQHAHSPRTRVGGAAPPGGRRRASRRLYFVRAPRGWLGARLGASFWPQIRRWDRRRCCWRISGGHREGQKSVGFCPLGGAHQSAWSLYIVLGHTPRRRRPAGARNGDFRKCV